MEREDRPCPFERTASAAIREIRGEIGDLRERVGGVEHALTRVLALLAVNLAGVSATLLEALSK